jgi:hypothetical protein
MTMVKATANQMSSTEIMGDAWLGERGKVLPLVSRAPDLVHRFEPARSKNDGARGRLNAVGTGTKRDQGRTFGFTCVVQSLKSPQLPCARRLTHI